MKDHELRELINDVTAVAKIYAHTQQLREQISHLITPVFKNLESESRLGHNLFADQLCRADKCLKDKNSLLADIQAIHKLAELVADYNILSICKKAISNANDPQL